MIAKQIIFFGQTCILTCDAKCEKAWGINSRPRIMLSDNPDDFEWLSDDELPDAPVDPGTYEGDEGKPQVAHDRLNKWCARECERHVLVDPGEDHVLPDFSERISNISKEK